VVADERLGGPLRNYPRSAATSDFDSVTGVTGGLQERSLWNWSVVLGQFAVFFQGRIPAL